MSLSELIRRDKNRPAVIMWSIANEPRTHLDASDEYFRYLFVYNISIELKIFLNYMLDKYF